MVRIMEIEKKINERNTIQNIVPAVYCVFEIDGNRYFQINTYGNRNRENSDRPDQIIQFDKETAEKLINLIKIEMSIS